MAFRRPRELTKQRMDMTEFREARQTALTKYCLCSDSNVVGMLNDFEHYLGLSKLLCNLEVARTENAEAMICVTCNATPLAIADQIIDEIERIWTQYLRYKNDSPHTFSTREGIITFESFTISAGGDKACCITGEISVLPFSQGI